MGMGEVWSLTPDPVVSFYLTTRESPCAWGLPLLCKWSTHDWTGPFGGLARNLAPSQGLGACKRNRKVVLGIRPTGLTQRVGSRNRGLVTPQLPPPQSDYVSGPWLTDDIIVGEVTFGVRTASCTQVRSPGALWLLRLPADHLPLLREEAWGASFGKHIGLFPAQGRPADCSEGEPAWRLEEDRHDL